MCVVGLTYDSFTYFVCDPLDVGCVYTCDVVHIGLYKAAHDIGNMQYPMSRSTLIR